MVLIWSCPRLVSSTMDISRTDGYLDRFQASKHRFESMWPKMSQAFTLLVYKPFLWSKWYKNLEISWLYCLNQAIYNKTSTFNQQFSPLKWQLFLTAVNSKSPNVACSQNRFMIQWRFCKGLQLSRQVNQFRFRILVPGTWNSKQPLLFRANRAILKLCR